MPSMTRFRSPWLLPAAFLLALAVLLLLLLPPGGGPEELVVGPGGDAGTEAPHGAPARAGEATGEGEQTAAAAEAAARLRGDDPAAAAGAVVRGRVLAAGTLRPLADVEVVAQRRHPGFQRLEARFLALFREGPMASAAREGLPEGFHVLGTARTDHEGRFELGGLAPGLLFLDARGPTVYCRTPRTLSVAAGEVRAGADLLASPGGRVHGVVLGPAGVPEEDASVVLRPGLNAFLGQVTERRYRWIEARTDARGRFDLHGVPPGKGYLLSASGPTMALEEVAGLAVEEGQSVAVTVRGRAGATVAGVVLSPEGQPVEGVRVALVHLDFTRLLFAGEGRGEPPATGPGGAFRMERVAPGRVALTAFDDRHAPAAIQELALVDGAAWDGLVLQLREGRGLAGVVVDAHDRPVAGARVSGMGIERSDMPDLRLALHAGERRAATCAEGRFALAGFHQRRAVLRVEKSGFLTERLPAVDLEAEDASAVRVVLRKGAVLEGEVVLESDGEEAPVERFSVQVLPEGMRAQDRGGRRGRPGRGAMGGPMVAGGPMMGPHDPGAFEEAFRRHEFQNSAGRFRLEGVRPGKVRVRVEAEGLRAAPALELELEEGEVRSELRFALRAGAAVAGRVVEGSGGVAVGEALVTARRVREGGRRGGGRDAFPVAFNVQFEDLDFLGLSTLAGRGSVLTDPSGTFRITGLEPGDYTLTARHPDHSRSAAVEVALALEAPLEGVEIALGSGGSVEGLVTGAGGRPLAEAVIVAFSLAAGGVKSSVTDAAGWYRIDHLPPGQYIVFKSRMEPQSENIFLDLLGNMRLRTVGVREGSVSRLDIADETEDGVRVWGIVRDGGEPVPQGMVTAFSSDRSGPFGVGVRGDATDQDGRYELPSLPPGTWFFQVSGRGGEGRRPWQSNLTVEVPFGVAEHRLDLDVPSSSISGVVRDSAGRPVHRAVVRAGLQDGAEGPDGLLGLILRNVVGEARTDQEGRYVLRRVAPGTYRLVASTDRMGSRLRGRDSDPDLGDALLEEVFVDGRTELAGMDFVLPVAARIHGTVVDGNGAPVEGAEVVYEREDGPRERRRDRLDLFGLSARAVRTGPDGSFTLTGLNPGRYTVSADQKGLSPGEEKGVVVSEGGEASVRLVLLRGATLRVRVTDLSGENVPIADVQVFNSLGEPVTRRVSALEAFRIAMRGRREGEDSGWYELGNVRPDTYRVVVRRRDQPELTTTRTLRDGEELSWEVSMKDLEPLDK